MAPLQSRIFLTPRSFKYLVILTVLRGSINKRLPTWVEHAAYFTLLEPAMLTMMHTYRHKYFTDKYRSFLERNAYPSFEKGYDVVRSCTQTHPHIPGCVESFKVEAPVALRKIASLYFKFYLLQYVLSLIYNIVQAARKRGSFTALFGPGAPRATSLLDLRRVDSTIEMKAQRDVDGQSNGSQGATSGKGKNLHRRPGVLAMTSKGEEKDDSERVLPGIATSATDGPEAEIDSSTDVDASEAEGRKGNGKRHEDSVKHTRRTMAAVLAKEVKEFTEGWGRSTLFLWTNMMIHRTLLCTLQQRVGPAYKHKLLYYLLSICGATAIVLERHSRVSIINRMLATFVIGELLPGTTWPSVLPYATALVPLAISGRLTTWVVLSGLLSALM
ncbi:hypothetical protein M427DRAFT_56700, partial [Gonapodya prolifera JEL478]